LRLNWFKQLTTRRKRSKVRVEVEEDINVPQPSIPDEPNAKGDESDEEPSTAATVSLPVEISEDLRRIIVLDTAISIRLENAEDEDTDDTASAEKFRHQILNLEDLTLTTQIRTGFDPKHPWPVDDYYQIKFSPSAQFFVLIRESTLMAEKGKDTYRPVWLMQVFRDLAFASSPERGPEYIIVASTRFFSVPEVSILSPTRGVAFHPSLPRLAFPQTYDGLPLTYIWDFDNPVLIAEESSGRPNPFPVSDPPIIDPVFSDDGKYIYGTDAPMVFGSDAISLSNLRSMGTPVIAEVPEYRQLEPIDSNERGKSKAPLTLQRVPTQCLVTLSGAAHELALKPKPLVQKANALAFANDGSGIAHVSQLQQLEKEGAVVLTSIGMNGELKSETLSRLPKDATHCVDVSLIHPESESENESRNVRLILDKAAQKIYTVTDLNSTILPAVLERSEASIPRYITTIPMNLVESKYRPREIMDIEASGSSHA
jgi:hypothetical protein